MVYDIIYSKYLLKNYAVAYRRIGNENLANDIIYSKKIWNKSEVVYEFINTF